MKGIGAIKGLNWEKVKQSVKEFNPSITTIDKYIIKKFIGTYFVALALIIGIVIIFDLSEKIDDFVDKKAPLMEIIFKYYANFIPYFMNMFSPMFVFITVIFFTSKMAANSEIIAILAGGISFKRLLWPYFVTSLFIFAFTLILNLYIIPPCNKGRLQFESQYVKKPFENTNRNMHYQIEKGTYLYVKSFSTFNNTAFDFTLETIEGQEITSKLTANNAQWDSTRGTWRLSDYVLRRYDNGVESVSTGKNLDTLLAIDVDYFYRRKHSEEALSIRELNNLIAAQKLRGDKSVQVTQIEKNTRFALPFSAFILTLIGVSLSSQKRRGGIGMNIGIGIALSFTYILFLQFARMFVYAGTFPPFVAMWIPNLVYLVIAIFLYRLAPK